MRAASRSALLNDIFTKNIQGKLDSATYVNPNLPSAKAANSFEDSEVKKQINKKNEEINSLLKSLEQPMHAKYNIALGALSLLSF